MLQTAWTSEKSSCAAILVAFGVNGGVIVDGSGATVALEGADCDVCTRVAVMVLLCSSGPARITTIGLSELGA